MIEIAALLVAALVIIDDLLQRRKLRHARNGWLDALAGWGVTIELLKQQDSLMTAQSELDDAAKALDLARSMSYGPQSTPPGNRPIH